MQRKAMDFVKQKFGNETIVGAEVGVAIGTHALNILENMPNVKVLYLVDPYLTHGGWALHLFNEGKITKKRLEFLKDFNRRECYAPQKGKKILAPFNNRIRWVYKEFEVCTVKDIPDPLDFVYIDGNHNYEYVKQDIILSTKLVKKGGVIGGHDFGWTPGAHEAVTEYCAKNNVSYHHKGEDWWFINEKKECSS